MGEEVKRGAASCGQPQLAFTGGPCAADWCRMSYYTGCFPCPGRPDSNQYVRAALTRAKTGAE